MRFIKGLNRQIRTQGGTEAMKTCDNSGKRDSEYQKVSLANGECCHYWSIYKFEWFEIYNDNGKLIAFNIHGQNVDLPPYIEKEIELI